MPNPVILVLALLTLGSSTALAEEVFRSTDGSKRIYARDRGENKQVLVDDTGKVVSYLDKRGEDDVIRSPDGSERIYLRDRGEDSQALVDDSGKVLGYRKRTDDDTWRYTEPDGTPVGTSRDED
jgi:hypothetical protein